MRKSDEAPKLVALSFALALLPCGSRRPAASALRTSARQALAPKRIISLIPAVTEMLFAMGAGERKWSRSPTSIAIRPRSHPAEESARCSILTSSGILSLKPDLVVVFGTQGDLIARCRAAEDADVQLSRSRRRRNHQHDTSDLGARVGAERRREGAGRRMRNGDGRHPARKWRDGRRPKRRSSSGARLGSLRGVWVSGGIGFMHDMLEVAGGADAFDDVKRKSLQATAEVMLARALEVIIEVRRTDEPANQLARERQILECASPRYRAGRTGRVYLLGDDRLSIPGPRVVDGIRPDGQDTSS